MASPVGITNCNSWFRADTGVTLSNSQLTAIVDQSPAAAATAMVTAWPLFTSWPKPALVFERGSQRAIRVTTPIDRQNSTLFFVMQPWYQFDSALSMTIANIPGPVNLFVQDVANKPQFRIYDGGFKDSGIIPPAGLSFICIRLTAGSIKISVNGKPVPHDNVAGMTAAATAGAAVSYDLANGAGNDLRGLVREWGSFSRALTDAEEAYLYRDCQSRHPELPLPGDPVWVITGHSFAYGSNATMTKSFAELLTYRFPRARWYNMSKGGWTGADVASKFAAAMSPLSDGSPKSGIIFVVGSNEIESGGRTGTQAYNDILPAIQTASANFAKVCVATIVPRGAAGVSQATFDAQALIFNNLVRGNTTDIDHVVDWAVDPILGAVGIYTKTDVMPDAVHWGDYGHGLSMRRLELPVDRSLNKQDYEIGVKGLDSASFTQAAIDRILAAQQGVGSLGVNADTGGADNLRLISGGIGVDGADVRAYLKSDFDAGKVAWSFIKGQTKTGPVNKADGFGAISGRMPRPMYLTPGATYTIAFNKPGVLSTIATEVTI